MVWLYPEEVRLLATLALAIPEGRGSLRFAPLDRVALDWSHSRPLSSDDLIGVASAHAQDLAAKHGSAPIELGAWEAASDEWQLRVFEAIDLSDELLIRGLHCLLKANRLAGDRELSAEGYMNVSISREAALELVRRRLQAQGHSSPSFRDAHEYVTNNFRLGDHLANQLSYQHDLWVETKHPNSSFGPVWMPQLMADDLYETYEGLVSVYRHLLSGEDGRATAYL
jgi:hypothetical protein